MLLPDNINRLMSANNVSNGDLAKYIGDVSGESVRRWRNGLAVPPIDKALKIAQYFNISVESLMGSHIHTEQIISLPLVGTISAGAFDILNEVEWNETCPVRVQLLSDRPAKECVTMKVMGDSMSPYLLPNDVLVVHRQTYAVNGNIIIAYDQTVNGYTVKKFNQHGDSVELVPMNPEYKVIRYNNPSEQILSIYGVCVGLERKLV